MRSQAGVALIALLSTVPISAAAAKCGPATVQVSVLDQGGSSLSGLAPSDFKVWIKNQSAGIGAVDFGVVSHRTLILVSRTTGMYESTKPELVRRLSEAIVSTAPGVVMRGTFATSLSKLEDARSSQPLAVDVAAASDGHNAIFDAVLAAMADIHTHRGDTIVVLTDASDDASRSSQAEVAQHLASSGARLFVVALPPSSGLVKMQPLVQLADASGGAVLAPLHVDATTNGVVISLNQVDGAAIKFNHDFTQYSNLYQLETNIETPDRPLPLRVEVDRRKLGGGKVVASTTVPPCSALSQ